MAKEGAKCLENLAPDIPLLTAEAIRKELRGKVVAEWSREWVEEHPCRQTKHFFPVPSKRLAVKFNKCSRVAFSALVQFVTGHNFMNRHSAIVEFGLPIDNDLAKCRHCDSNEEESTFHVLVDCDAFARQRLAVFHTLELSPPFKLTPMKIINFIKETRLDGFQLTVQ